jgi:chromosome segregation ATPase
MRLTKIKLAGFKTFVDPTTLSFPSNLTGIIGPNGCGKSNIIDAIRWVMGESSAKNLRGDSMDDVIFSGSSSRPEISKAFVELNFDNSTNSLDSKFARYSEITIRREVSRDGISNYFLNNTRCRRKDIREVFLGTGLGPRSYAIIEQGMISRLVEAKPEELRTYLEEAAGISKYKEKRRETELRLKHTKENLNRLNDIMKEITSQLGKLERQAKSANDYKELKNNERESKLELLSIKWNNFNKEIDKLEKEISKITLEQEKQNSLLTNKEKLIEENRQKRNTEQEVFNSVQSDFYHIGSEIAKCEKDIEHSQESEFSRKKLAEELIKNIDDTQNEISDESKKLKDAQDKLKETDRQLEDTSNSLSQLNKEKSDANFAIQNWQSTYNEFISQQLETVKKQEIEKTKLEASEKSIGLLTKRLKILESDTVNEDEKSDDKNIIINSANDIQEKISSLLIDFDRSDALKKNNDKLLKQLPLNIKNILDGFKSLVEKIRSLIRSQQDEINDIKDKIIDYKKLTEHSIKTIDTLEADIKNNSIKKQQLDKEKIELKQIIDKIAWKVEEAQKRENDYNVSTSSLLSEETSIKSNIQRLEKQKQDLEDRKLILLSEGKDDDKPSSNMQTKLKTLLNDKKNKEELLSKSRNNLSSFDNDILTLESDKNDISQEISNLREKLESIKISSGEKTAQRNALKDNSDIPISEIENAIKNIKEDKNIEDVEKIISKLQQKINSLGAINLAAIDELKDQQERKTYLDNQYNDLSESIKTLDNAIKKIDNETKSKFKEIFDNINDNLNTFFTKIFGGGKAYLELTENDLLNTGVTIMARPPGKLVKNINLLSGGEKAGTGIAFVFSIFKINPAPFCLLDEVDAPLDDANNNRFCRVVKEMSESVQFIFITHNKLTMKLADILSGVTMREPGISKLVSVNVNEAVDLSANKEKNSDIVNLPS